MIKILDITDVEAAESVLRIQLPAYNIEAKLLNFYDIPPLHETVNSLLESRETFFGFYQEDELAGVISISFEDNHLVICRLIVHPLHFRKGIGSALLQHVVDSYPEASCFKVSTGEKNEPAVRLYHSFGFQKTGKSEIAPDVYISHFMVEKSLET
ncbi:GNAT family N-acetyltransferase [Heyndrickxia acidicola]|uniref:GNAT family N-acetyltransferase n=1 Tax=Heyndrickxia acidicola TaxID=209389 RepID=A0ABU6MJ06_9BACI|nr:GNAT family N-acetyltransferase [Heyndrickxia acidicola]MED1204640.1 GNAT family N-acetyltransferase [Heyndrickxia acidicola]